MQWYRPQINESFPFPIPQKGISFKCLSPLGERGYWLQVYEPNINQSTIHTFQDHFDWKIVSDVVKVEKGRKKQASDFAFFLKFSLEFKENQSGISNQFFSFHPTAFDISISELKQNNACQLLLIDSHLNIVRSIRNEVIPSFIQESISNAFSSAENRLDYESLYQEWLSQQILEPFKQYQFR